MSNIVGIQQSRLYPSSQNPNLIADLVEQFDYEKLISGHTHYGSEGQQAHYINTVSVYNTPSVVGNAMSWRTDQDTSSLSLSNMVVPYYLVSSVWHTDPQTSAALSAMGLNISQEELGRMLSIQGMKQRRALSYLFGVDPAYTQGIVNGSGVAAVLPADSKGVTHLVGYQPTEIYEYFVGQIRTMLNYSFGMLKPVRIFSSWRVINYLQSVIVPLTSNQLPGAGTGSVTTTMKYVLDPILQGQFEFYATSYLQDSSTTTENDTLLIISPGLSVEEMAINELNATNKLGGNVPNLYVDEVIEGREWISPPDGGRIRHTIESIYSVPAIVRKLAIKKVTVPYSK